MQGIYGLAELLAYQEGCFCRELIMWKVWFFPIHHGVWGRT